MIYDFNMAFNNLPILELVGSYILLISLSNTKCIPIQQR